MMGEEPAGRKMASAELEAVEIIGANTCEALITSRYIAHVNCVFLNYNLVIDKHHHYRPDHAKAIIPSAPLVVE